MINKTIFQEVFQAANVPVEFEEFWISEVQARCDPELLEKMVESVLRNRVALKGLFYLRIKSLIKL